MIKMTEEQFKDLDESMIGICLHCKSERLECEPDARKYRCEDCGRQEVYGVSELLIMGEIEFVEEKESEL